MTFYGYKFVQTEIDRGHRHGHMFGQTADSPVELSNLSAVYPLSEKRPLTATVGGLEYNQSPYNNSAFTALPVALIFSLLPFIFWPLRGR